MLDRPAQQSFVPSSRAKRGICFFGLMSWLFLSASCSAQTPPKRPPIVGIARVRIYVTDLDKTSEVYAKLFALPKGGSGCRDVSGACFTVEWGQRQSILLQKAPSSALNNRIAEVAFVTFDLDQMHQYLVARGVSCGAISKEPSRVSHFELKDAEGNAIGFIQPALDIDDPLWLPKQPVGDLLIHAGFVVHDRAAEDHFYKDILGFRPYWHGGMKDDETNWVDMQVPDGTDWIEYMLNVPSNADHHTLGVMNHIALGVPSIKAAREQLIKNGWKPGEEPKIGRDGKWQLNLYDPDDTRVELMEFRPVQKPCCSEFTGPHPGQMP